MVAGPFKATAQSMGEEAGACGRYESQSHTSDCVTETTHYYYTLDCDNGSVLDLLIETETVTDQQCLADSGGGGCNPNVENCSGDGGGGGGGGGGYDPGGGSSAPTQAQLYSLINFKPHALVRNIPCPIVMNWIDLANHEVNSAILQKVNSIVGQVTGPDRYGLPTSNTYVADVLDINDAYSSVVNMDYFSVNVATLPVVNGNRLTPEEFLNQIRKDMNLYVNTNYSEFYPYIDSDRTCRKTMYC